METGALKRFATQARIQLKEGVRGKLRELGFDAEGRAVAQPRLVSGAAIYNNAYYEKSFYYQWRALDRAIQTEGVKAVCEEAAYTWFNRFMAIRILQKNGFIQPVLSFDNPDIRVPHIVSEARQGRYPDLDETERMRLLAVIDDATRTYEQFSLLVIAFCRHTPIISRCFGLPTDYTELLLPREVLDREGFLDMLNHTSFITDEDYKTTELLGWLYQFYISDCKDEVFAKFRKGKKAEAEDIAPATQIFTPDWIVKYMVQNTVGRIYLDNNPDSPLTEEMMYLVTPTDSTPDDALFRYGELEKLTVLDPACGSGHILLEAFDLLYAMYLKAFYTRQEAVEHIFRHNLTGMDIDSRAKQLATFALLLKACQKDTSFLDGHILPNVLDMPHGVTIYTWKETVGRLESDLPIGRCATQEENEEIGEAFRLMEAADTLGSIMKFKLSDSTREYMQAYVEAFAREPKSENHFAPIIDSFRVMLALTEKYAAVITNPPYMGSGNMNAVLSKYIENNYVEGKADFCTAFMMMQAAHVSTNGYYANIIPPSWMFLSSFEKLRKTIIENNVICSLLHLSRGIFGADFGSVSCVVQNRKDTKAKGIYFRLIERTFQEFDQKHLQLLFEKTLENHDFRYSFGDYTKDVKDIAYSENGAKIYYPNVAQQNFEKIPGSPIGYWVSEKMFDCFTIPNISHYVKPSKGMMPGSDFILFHWEVSIKNIANNVMTHEESANRNEKWYHYFKGGNFRRWYGNMIYVVDYQHDGCRVKIGDRNPHLYFKNNINWSKISSNKFSARCGRISALYDDAACQCEINDKSKYKYILSLFNSKCAQEFLNCISQTFNYVPSDICKIPYIESNRKYIDNYTLICISISKLDWDAHETSWDFQENELVAVNNVESYRDVMREYANYENSVLLEIPRPHVGSLEWLVSVYKTKWETKFLQLHANEEELNRRFIEIYGLEGELTPDVPYSEITILQQGEISIEDQCE